MEYENSSQDETFLCRNCCKFVFLFGICCKSKCTMLVQPVLCVKNLVNPTLKLSASQPIGAHYPTWWTIPKVLIKGISSLKYVTKVQRDPNLAVPLRLPPVSAPSSDPTTHHLIPFPELERLNRINSGTGGTVYKVVHRCSQGHLRPPRGVRPSPDPPRDLDPSRRRQPEHGQIISYNHLEVGVGGICNLIQIIQNIRANYYSRKDIMITMDVKGITWVGNLYQKFENMCLEAQDVIYQDTVDFIENQMQAVGESVKKLSAEVMRDLLLPPSCDLDDKVASELRADQCPDAGFDKKPNQGFKERPLKADAKQTTKDTMIDHHVDNDATRPVSYDGTCETDVFMSSSGDSVKGSNFIPRSRQYVGSMDIKSNLGTDENQVNKKKGATEIFGEITLAETNRCKTSQSCRPSSENHNQNHAASVSKPASAEVTRLPSAADCCYEIEDVSTEQFPNIPVLVKSVEQKQMNTCCSSAVLFGEQDGFSMDRTIDSDDCSSSMAVLSHSEQGHKATQGDESKLEETCVIVTGDELKFLGKEGGNVKTNKKKKRQSFSLSKKSARKQEYEELAVWHRNSEKVKGDCVEDQKKMLLPSISDPEWELI
ncbi:hypothetical protein RIF29_31301 [Crotalaria pallida]|uniref:Uncharacterized protein n=1 Tax=Crotalaria pallida TaxID=3830 RepID=A0AAN9EH22_CROPI